MIINTIRITINSVVKIKIKFLEATFNKIILIKFVINLFGETKIHSIDLAKINNRGFKITNLNRVDRRIRLY